MAVKQAEVPHDAETGEIIEGETGRAVSTLKPAEPTAQQLEEFNLKMEEQLSMEDNSGLGKDEDASGPIMVPLVNIFQPNSPQVNRGNPMAYIEGAEPGAIWLRSIIDSKIIPGNEGFVFQPCYFHVEYIEWVPRDRGGGFVGRHLALPPDTKSVRQQGQGFSFFKYFTPGGNELVETHCVTGIVHEGWQRTYFQIPLVSTGISIYEAWKLYIKGKLIPPEAPFPQQFWGKKAPPRMQLFRVTTKLNQNKKGVWYSIKPAFETFSKPMDWENGAKLAEAFKAGQLQVAEPETAAVEEQGPNAPM